MGPSRSTQHPAEYNLLLTATLCLLAFGAVMVFSATSAPSVIEGGDGTGALIKYLIYGAAGLAIMHLLARRGLDLVRHLTPVILVAAFVMLVAVKLPGLGVTVNGATRWLGVGGFTFQPSEIMKLALVLYLSLAFSQQPRQLASLKRLWNPTLLVVGLASVLILSQPDLGTTIIIGGTVAALLLVAGAPNRVLITLGAWSVGAVAVLAVAAPYRRARLTSFLDPWADATGSGFQAVQGQIAIGSGGLFGQGPGQSVQKIFYLPEANTDFILAVIGEELGLIGVFALLALYGLIAYAGLRTAKGARTQYERLVAAGITSLIVGQTLLNVFAVLGLAPLTGEALPFVSNGSTSITVLLAAMGLLLNIASRGALTLQAVQTPPDAQGSVTHARGSSNGGNSRARRAGSGGRRRAAS